jgi:hypothetical protein
LDECSGRLAGEGTIGVPVSVQTSPHNQLMHKVENNGRSEQAKDLRAEVG